MQIDPEHLNLRILLSYQGVNRVCLLQLTLWQFSCRHRSILSSEEEATAFQQINGFKLLYKLHLSTQSFSHLSVSITFGRSVLPPQIQLLSQGSQVSSLPCSLCCSAHWTCLFLHVTPHFWRQHLNVAFYFLLETAITCRIVADE